MTFQLVSYDNIDDCCIFFLNRSVTSQNLLFNKAGINFKALFNKAGINFKAVPEMLTLLQQNSPTLHGAAAALKAALSPPAKTSCLAKSRFIGTAAMGTVMLVKGNGSLDR